MDYVGLKRTIAEMITDIPIPVEVERFTNDVAEIKNKDDVLTYLIHLGYLAYDEKSCTAYIPNKEIHSVLKEYECPIKQFTLNARNTAAGYNKEEILALLDSSISHDRIASTLRVSPDVVESVIEEDTIEVDGRKCSRWRISKWADNMGMSYEEFLDEVKAGKLSDTICRALQ